MQDVALAEGGESGPLFLLALKSALDTDLNNLRGKSLKIDSRLIDQSARLHWSALIGCNCQHLGLPCEIASTKFRAGKLPRITPELPGKRPRQLGPVGGGGGRGGT